MILDEGPILLYYGHSLTLDCIEKNEVWYEYYDPSEMQHILELGFSKEWFYSKFIDDVPIKEIHVKYAIKNKELISTEFSHIACRIKLDEDIFIDGYIFKIFNDVKSLQVIIDGSEILTFFSNKVFATENIESLTTLGKYVGLSKISDLKSFDLIFSDTSKAFFQLDSTFPVC